jgi:hypothetical protein
MNPHSSSPPLSPAGPAGGNPSAMETMPDIVDEVQRLMEASFQRNLHLRLIGGLAIRVHSPTAAQRTLRRDYPDIDFVVPKKDKRRLDGFFGDLGYTPDRNFNLLNGDRRQIFFDAETGRRIDVFVGDFEMCHKLPMRNRLESHPVTIPLAELFLSKTQIVELNRKDALDIVSLLLDNEVGFTDDTINMDRIARLCLKDWGLYKTLTINLSKVEDVLVNENPGLNDEDTQRVLERINAIRRVLDRAAKPFLWKVRDRVGTRVRWYTEVEEVNR